MTEIKNKRVRITLDEEPQNNRIVVIDPDTLTEQDITGMVSRVEIQAQAGRGVVATLTLPWASGEFLATAAHVPLSTASALQALGWTPPPGQPRLYDLPAGRPMPTQDRVTDTIKEPDGTVTHAPTPPAVYGEVSEDGTFREFPTVPAPASTEPGCQHPDCVLDHPHPGPAVLDKRFAPEPTQPEDTRR